MCSLSLSTPSHQRCIHAPFASLHKNISCGAGAVWGVLPSACWRLLTSILRGLGKGGHREVDMRPWINRKKRIKARHLDLRLGPWNLAHWLAHTWLLINTCSMNEWRNWVVNEWTLVSQQEMDHELTYGFSDFSIWFKLVAYMFVLHLEMFSEPGPHAVLWILGW